MVKWVNGLTKVQNRAYGRPVSRITQMLEMLKMIGVRERHAGADMVRHVRRRFNSCVDALAGRRMDLVQLHARLRGRGAGVSIPMVAQPHREAASAGTLTEPTR